VQDEKTKLLLVKFIDFLSLVFNEKNNIVELNDLTKASLKEAQSLLTASNVMILYRI